MEGKWGFINRHCDPADGEVVGLQVSRVPRVPGVRCPGEAAPAGVPHAHGHLRPRASPPTGAWCAGITGLELAGAERFRGVSPFLSVSCGSAVLSKSQRVGRVLRPHYQKDFCLFLAWTCLCEPASRSINLG